VDIFHHEVVASFVLSGIEDGDDACMLEAGNDASLGFERRGEFAIGREVAKELDGDPTPEARVFGEPDFRHAASAQQPFEPVS